MNCHFEVTTDPRINCDCNIIPSCIPVKWRLADNTAVIQGSDLLGENSPFLQIINLPRISCHYSCPFGDAVLEHTKAFIKATHIEKYSPVKTVYRMWCILLGRKEGACYFGACPRKRSRYSNKVVSYSNKAYRIVKEAVYG